jgi:hypothetical protein
MNWLTKVANGCLTTGVALIVSVTLLAGDKMAMASTRCYQCLQGCPLPITAGCLCSCANNQCKGEDLYPACAAADTGNCQGNSTTCKDATQPCPPSSYCQNVPTGCPSTVHCENCGCFNYPPNNCRCSGPPP